MTATHLDSENKARIAIMSKPTSTLSIGSRPFGSLPDGAEARLYTLGTESGFHVSITNFGGAIQSLTAPDRAGVYADIVLGYESLEGYLTGKSFFGGIVGRFGNRIANGRFILDGKQFSLPLNNGRNHLHGGPMGFDRVFWEANPLNTPEGPALKLTRTSPDGEEGYPGNLRVEVTYTVVGSDSLSIHYRAETDRPTPVNLTNHAYFNLAGHDSGDILRHELTLFADRFTPVDPTLIPTGELRETRGTAFDFRELPVGQRIDDDDEQLRFAGGYDHNFVLTRDASAGLARAARVFEPVSGRTLEIFTTEPGIQFYSGNFLSGSDVGNGGATYGYRTGFCLETQHFPDSPNQPRFPNTILRPGEIYESTTVLRFSPNG
jgi:aldose 1-epimerase